MIDKNKAKELNFNILDSDEVKNDFITTLKSKFPQTIIDGAPNLNNIKILLGLDNIEPKGYELNFTGKEYANSLYSTPVDFELYFEKKLSKNKENTNNSIIIGDNLDVLKILRSAYSEKIKMIYIDPPYNTGGDGFVYKDNFRDDYRQILKEIGLIEIDENGKEIESEKLNFFKDILGAKTHSAWLSFMLPRLKLARDLLKDDGVIFISIDDNEQANLKILCDEIFGGDNFVSCFVWQKKSGGGQAKYFYEGHEYILIYTKNKSNFPGLLQYKEKGKINDDFIRKMHGKFNDEMREFIKKYPNELINHRNLMFEELDIFLKEGKISQKKFNEINENIKKGLYFLKQYKDTKFHLICSYNDNNSTLMYSIISKIWTSDGNLEIEKTFGKPLFKNPKPTKLIKQLLKLNTNPNNEDIILDFFAGSGTTAQAVMELNNEDGGNRKFILVQLDEKIDEKNSKVAYEFCKNELKSNNPNISDITIERVNRAGRDLNCDNGYKVYSLKEKAKLIFENNQASFRTSVLSSYDIARNLALFGGKTLDKNIKEIVENSLFECEDIYLVKSLNKKTEKILKENKNKYVLIYGYSEYLSLESFLNLGIANDEKVSIVY